MNPTNGLPPVGISNQMFYTAADNANRWMATYSRGYRYRITEVTNIGGPTQGGVNGPSQWYEQPTLRNSDPTLVSKFKNLLQTDSRYLLRTDQVNIYVSVDYVTDASVCHCNNGAGAASPIPPNELDTASEIYADDGPFWMLHEMGHFFGLQHTFAGELQTNCAPGFVPGTSGLSDTVRDSTCWTTEDEMAQYNYGVVYAALNPTQQTLVDGTWYNVMSYHNPWTKNTVETNLTELQLDVEANMANTFRSAFASGHTIFVSPSGSDSATTNSSAIAYASLSKGLSAANPAGGDIILFRPGSYNQQLTINQPVTLRATRVGPATFGR